MLLSVITPVHSTSSKYLDEAYRQLSLQGYPDWEWVLGINNGGRVPGYIERDPHVAVFRIPDETSEGEPTEKRNKIGRLKKTCAVKARGDVIVELDADDMLTPDALDEIAKAFDDPSVHMAYSNSAEFIDGSWEPFFYSEYWGWRTRDFTFKSHALKEMIAWPPSPHSFRRIEWAPDHVRAWRTSSYFAIGGHDESMPTADDHDLCCRFYIEYGASGIRHIDKCLYLYRRHGKMVDGQFIGENTSVAYNGEVQALVDQNYLKYSRAMMIRWAKDSGLAMLDLGGRFGAWEGFTTVDLHDADLIADLNERWPFEDNSVGILRASHVFEHLADPIHTMNEAYRVLAPGGFLLIEVPSTDGRGAFQDPTHKSFWNANSIWYYTRESHARFIRPAYTGKFQASRVVDYFPSQFERDHVIVVTQADLIALKSPYTERPVGEVLI